MLAGLASAAGGMGAAARVATRSHLVAGAVRVAMVETGLGESISFRFNAPPNWPTPPTGWQPPSGWAPDPAWGPPPPGWQLWVEEVTPPRPVVVPGLPVAQARATVPAPPPLASAADNDRA